MTALAELIAHARTHSGAASDTELGGQVGVSRQTLNEWRAGEKRITDEHLARLIELAGADPSVAIQVRASLAKSAQERRLWTALARRIGVAATLAAAALLAIPSEAYDAGNAYYVKWRARLFPSRNHRHCTPPALATA